MSQKHFLLDTERNVFIMHYRFKFNMSNLNKGHCLFDTYVYECVCVCVYSILLHPILPPILGQIITLAMLQEITQVMVILRCLAMGA